jgi:hypothetical protein
MLSSRKRSEAMAERLRASSGWVPWLRGARFQDVCRLLEAEGSVQVSWFVDGVPASERKARKHGGVKRFTLARKQSA